MKQYEADGVAESTAAAIKAAGEARRVTPRELQHMYRLILEHEGKLVRWHWVVRA